MPSNNCNTNDPRHNKTGRLDLVSNYSWTSLPSRSALRKEAPRVHVISYALQGTQLKQWLNGYSALTSQTAKEFYSKLYLTKRKREYIFPFLTDSVKSFGSSFSESFATFSSKGSVSRIMNSVSKDADLLVGAALGGFNGVLSMVEGAQEKVNSAIESMPTGGYKAIDSLKGVVSNVASNTSGAYIETPQFYQFQNSDAPLEVAFTLSNTMNANDIKKNKEFIDEFVSINKPTRNNAISMSYPHIYRVYVPGQRYMYWAYLDKLGITMVGNRRLINNKVVPEAYDITMSFKSLIIETSNFVSTL
jgi:hypothetical protein